MKKSILIIFLGFLLTNIRAQQIGLYDHYFYNPITYNPAFTGDKGFTNIMLLSRAQWTGFEGAPKLNMVAADGNLFNKKLGIGAVFISDKKGINERIGGSVLSSYKVTISDDSHLRFGASFRFLNHNMDFSKTVVQEITDPTILTMDQSKTNFDGNVGVSFTWRELQVGVAVDQILQNKASFLNEGGTDVSYTQSHHFMNSIKYRALLIKEKNVFVVPQALIRYVPNAPLQYEASATLDWNKKFWMGAAYKNEYAVSAHAGISLLKRFDIGYSYDIITSDIGQYSGISHELMLNFKFANSAQKEKKEKPEKVKKEKPKEEVEESIEEEKVEEKKVEEEKPKEESKYSKVVENGITVITNPVEDFKDVDSHLPEKGVYIVVGSFLERGFAIEYVKTIAAKGFSQTNWVYSEESKYNYVYTYKFDTKEQALTKLEESRLKATKGAWLLVLVK
ncbi:MAG: type IX secretion system membrane protein PorP/SprF [Vicingus serpentipes]|nr:type IX secretion system membrane protein PorP/SprF [Vicingus serpentipes]